jgi:hypothetical protein
MHCNKAEPLRRRYGPSSTYRISRSYPVGHLSCIGRLGGHVILLVTHAPEQAIRIASRHLEVRDGRLVEETP